MYIFINNSTNTDIYIYIYIYIYILCVYSFSYSISNRYLLSPIVTISLKNKKTRGDEFRGFMLSARAEGGQSDKFGSFIIEPKERHKYQTKCSNVSDVTLCYNAYMARCYIIG